MIMAEYFIKRKYTDTGNSAESYACKYILYTRFNSISVTTKVN